MMKMYRSVTMRGSGRSRRGGRFAAAAVGLMLGVALAGTAPAAAQADGQAVRTPQSEEAARRAIGLVRSPYCPGLMLEVCPSEPAELLRDSLRMLAAQGKSADELVEWMVAGHGEEWRAVPKRRGAGIWAWLLPPFALLFGAGFVVTRVRSMRAATEARGASPATGLSTEERHRLDAELEELERLQEQEEAQ